MPSIHRLGFRRTFLPQKYGQKDNGSDGQKLTLPILKGFEPKQRLPQKFS